MSVHVDFKFVLTDREATRLEKIAREGGFNPADIVEGVLKQYLQDDESKAIEFRRRAHKLLEKRSGSPRIVDQYGRQYFGARGAAEALGLHQRLVYAVLHGKRKQTGGYSFSYVSPKK